MSSIETEGEIITDRAIPHGDPLVCVLGGGEARGKGRDDLIRSGKQAVREQEVLHVCHVRKDANGEDENEVNSELEWYLNQ